MKNVPSNLSNLESKVDTLDVAVPVNLSKLKDAVKNYVLKKDLYNARIKNIENKIPDTTSLATNITFNAKINEVKREISSITNLATTAVLNTRINKIKDKIPSNTNLTTTTTALTAVEIQIPIVSNLVKKTDYNTKTSEIENKFTADHGHDIYITTQELNRKF